MIEAIVDAVARDLVKAWSIGFVIGLLTGGACVTLIWWLVS